MSSLPNFFIVGAARAGTTSFANYLGSHPDVYMSPVKEPHFFATEVDPEKFREGFPRQIDPQDYFQARPLKPAHCIYVREWQQYAELFGGVRGERAIGEASVSYLYSKFAAQRICDACPGARILIFLRNPIDRAYSHYLMDHDQAAVGLRDFVEAVAFDFACPRKGWGISNLYVELGLYHEQVKRYLDLFPEAQVRVLFFDDYERDARQAMAGIRGFLGLADVDQDGIAYERLNAARRTAHFPSMASNLRSSAIGRLANRLPAEIKKTIWTVASRAPEPLTPEVRRELSRYFREDVTRLSALLGRDLGHWIEGPSSVAGAMPALGAARAARRG